jgi:hypothetical protein
MQELRVRRGQTIWNYHLSSGMPSIVLVSDLSKTSNNRTSIIYPVGSVFSIVDQRNGGIKACKAYIGVQNPEVFQFGACVFDKDGDGDIESTDRSSDLITGTTAYRKLLVAPAPYKDDPMLLDIGLNDRLREERRNTYSQLSRTIRLKSLSKGLVKLEYNIGSWSDFYKIPINGIFPIEVEIVDVKMQITKVDDDSITVRAFSSDMNH